MYELFKILLTTQQFIPHGHCYLWQSNLLGLHIVSDSLIALAYYSIPLTLLYFVRQRQDLPFNWIFLLFGTFIITCGTTHLMEIWTLWYPTYWVSGGIKAIAAVVSLYTAWELIYLMPQVLALPSPAQLEAANQELKREISERQQVELVLQEQEAMLRRIGDNLPNGAIYKVIRELDGSDRFYYLSAGIATIMEVSAADALRDAGLLYRQFIPEDIPRLEAAVNASMQHLSIFNIQLRICTPSGQIKWCHFRSSPRQLEDGRVAWDGLVVDVTEPKRTEEIVRKNEALLEESQRVARLGNWEYDLSTGQISWSKGLFELFKRDSQLLAPSYAENLQLYHPEDRKKLAQAVERAISTGESYKLVLRATRTDNVDIYVEGIGYAEFNAHQEVVRLYGTAQDISEQQAVLRERKQAEQALQEKEHFLRSIYDGVGQSIFVVDVVDNDFRYVGFNPAHEELTGLRSNEVQGKTPEQVLPPQLAAIVRKYYQDCLNAGTSITYNECLPFRGQEIWWITNLTPLRDENLSIYRIVGSCINITEQKHAQQMRELQAVITRNMAEGICLVRANDGIIVYANPKFENMFGYDTDELNGLHISIVNYADDQAKAEEVNQAITAAVLEYGEASYEVHNVKKNGTPFWCSATTSMFEHPEYGQVFVAVHQDITEQKQAEEKITASLKEKEVLLKEIHHRVKNNLGIVSSLLQMQCRRTQDPQALEILRDSQNRIASIALVHEKLYRSTDLANIDFAQYIPDLTTHLFDSYNITPNCIKLKIQVNDASLDIETAIPCGLIINELVSNALKYAFTDQSTGEILVSLEQQEQDNLILTIRDNGIGLPQDFDSRNTKTLGIILVQGLVKQLRGEIEINSQQGTEFKITFTKSRA
ncbi:PAS domain S-box protein [Nostoc sp. PCC 7107]|uniref:PAS domain S-box protein n=1 Tax=Nostoc sp. PCC 7107 TaxID=317936 RepID=UPI00029F4767|nr:PAS domain S-box protein [Nostoc sp. PCC 7107]AFY43806.1 signal transduction histidine kinase [Nostoc sp. PCC 7107]